MNLKAIIVLYTILNGLLVYGQADTCVFGKAKLHLYGDEDVMDRYRVYLEEDHVYTDSFIEFRLKDSLPSGCYRVYYDSSFDNIAIKAYYINGHRYGYWQMYDTIGNLTREIYYEMHSVELCSELQEINVYYENNQISNIYSFDRKSFYERVFNGPVMMFHENGSMKSIENYYKGERHGFQQYFHENGNIDATGFYNLGRAIGVWRTYDSSGVLLSEKHHYNFYRK